MPALSLSPFQDTSALKNEWKLKPNQIRHSERKAI